MVELIREIYKDVGVRVLSVRHSADIGVTSDRPGRWTGGQCGRGRVQARTRDEAGGLSQAV